MCRDAAPPCWATWRGNPAAQVRHGIPITGGEEKAGRTCAAGRGALYTSTAALRPYVPRPSIRSPDRADFAWKFS